MHTIFPNKITSALIVFLVLLNIFSWTAYFSQENELEKARNISENIERSQSIMDFQRLFVDKVLKSDGVVDYNTRKELEQSVGRTNSEPVISAWNSFLEAKTESEGQDKVKELLAVIAKEAFQNK